MNELLSRKVYSSNELAVNGAIEQMSEHEAIGDQASVDDSAERHQARVQARFESDKRDNDAWAILRKKNQEAIAVKELTSDQVYPKRRGFK